MKERTIIDREEVLEKMIRREDDIGVRKEDSDSTNNFSKEEKDFRHIKWKEEKEK